MKSCEQLPCRSTLTDLYAWMDWIPNLDSYEQTRQSVSRNLGSCLDTCLIKESALWLRMVCGCGHRWVRRDKNPPAKSLSDPKHRQRIIRSEREGSYKRRQGIQYPLLPIILPSEGGWHDRKNERPKCIECGAPADVLSLITSRIVRARLANSKTTKVFAVEYNF